MDSVHNCIIGTMNGVGYSVLTSEQTLLYIENRIASTIRAVKRCLDQLERCVAIDDLTDEAERRYRRRVNALRETVKASESMPAPTKTAKAPTKRRRGRPPAERRVSA